MYVGQRRHSVESVSTDPVAIVSIVAIVSTPRINAYSPLNGRRREEAILTSCQKCLPIMYRVRGCGAEEGGARGGVMMVLSAVARIELMNLNGSREAILGSTHSRDTLIMRYMRGDHEEVGSSSSVVRQCLTWLSTMAANSTGCAHYNHQSMTWLAHNIYGTVSQTVETIGCHIQNDMWGRGVDII